MDTQDKKDSIFEFGTPPGLLKITVPDGKIVSPGCGPEFFGESWSQSFGHFSNRTRALTQDCATSLPKRVPKMLTTALMPGHAQSANGFSLTAFELPLIRISIVQKKLIII